MRSDGSGEHIERQIQRSGPLVARVVGWVYVMLACIVAPGSLISGAEPVTDASRFGCGAGMFDQGRQARDATATASDCPLMGACDQPGARDHFLGSTVPTRQIVRLYFLIHRDDEGNNPTADEPALIRWVDSLNVVFSPYHIGFVFDWQYFDDSRYYEINSWAEWTEMTMQYAVAPDQQRNIFVVRERWAGPSEYDSWSPYAWTDNILHATGSQLMNAWWVEWYGDPETVSILAHELGHGFGLWHPFHGVSEVELCGPCYEEPEMAESDLVGDFCSDTDPAPMSYTCGPEMSGDPCSEGSFTGAHWQNLMNYAWPPSCKTYFSDQQGARMRCWLAGPLSSWIDHAACEDLTDTDADGVGDACDNCPGMPNADQADVDGDLVGDLCDDCRDSDHDGLGDPGYGSLCPEDNCPYAYNPDQADRNGDGIGDVCMYIPETWDTVTSDCTWLSVSTDGGYGVGSDGSLGYANNGDCGNGYLWLGSVVLSYYDAVRGEVAVHAFSDLLPVLGETATEPTTSTPDYDVFETGTSITKDLAFASEVTWWMPASPEDCHFVVKRYKIYRYGDNTVFVLSVGELVDWNIPMDSSQNRGGYDSGYGLLYQYGGPSLNPDDDCRDNTRRFGGITLLGSYSHYDRAVSLEPYGGIIDPFPPYMTSGNFDSTALFDIMHQPGFAVASGADDFFSGMVYEGGVSLPPGDTLYVYSALITLLDGTVDDLRAEVVKAREWSDLHLGLYGCCEGRVGDANGLSGDEPTIGDVSLIIDALFITATEAPLTTPPACMAEADINLSSQNPPAHWPPVYDDITVGDISALIDYLFITGSSLGLPACL